MGYVLLLTAWFIAWICASPALKTLYETALLFCKTAHGKNIFGDRFMEWVIENSRFYLGKKIAGSVDSHLNKVQNQKQCVTLRRKSGFETSQI